MGRNSGFTFKQFHVAHDRCAMKVGTDGILLGAWAPVTNARRVLDIGSGSGLIALMLAQRSPADCRIDAVELDSNAARQARENAAASPGMNGSPSSRVPFKPIRPPLTIHRLQPALLRGGPVIRDPARALARHTGGLDSRDLLAACDRLLAPTARLRWSCQRPWPMKFYASRRIMICTPFVIQLLSPELEKRQIVFYCDLAED